MNVERKIDSLMGRHAHPWPGFGHLDQPLHDDSPSSAMSPSSAGPSSSAMSPSSAGLSSAVGPVSQAMDADKNSGGNLNYYK